MCCLCQNVSFLAASDQELSEDAYKGHLAGGCQVQNVKLLVLQTRHFSSAALICAQYACVIGSVLSR